jgi:hypothetical protein
MSVDQKVVGGTVVRFDAHPKPPRSMRDTGLEEGFLIDLLVKVLYRMGLERNNEISRVVKLSPVIVDQMLHIAQELKLIETLGQRGASLTAEMRWQLTGQGRTRALEAMAKTEYAGPAPVPLADFVAQCKAPDAGEGLREPHAGRQPDGEDRPGRELGPVDHALRPRR